MNPVRPFFIFFSIIFSVIVFLLLGEAIIRLEGFIKGNRIWTPDKYLYVQHIPNSRFTNIGYYKEYVAKGRVDKWGFIGRGYGIKKAKGTYRIIVLGDSFTEAVQVDMDKNYCSVLEKLFNKSGKNCEVINAGISDYSPKLEYLYLKNKIINFDPDHIILQLFPNDVYDDYKHRDIKEQVHTSAIKKAFIYNHSKLYHYFLRQKAKLLKKIFVPEKDNLDIERFFFIKKGNDELKKKMWSTTAYHLLKIKKMLDEREIVLTIFVMPMEAQISLPHQMSPASQFYFKETPTDDFNRAVEKFCRLNSIDFIDMLSIFRDNKNLDLYFPMEGHLTKTGHLLVAEALFKHLKNSLWIYP